MPAPAVEAVTERRSAGRAIGERMSGGVWMPLGDEETEDAGE